MARRRLTTFLATVALATGLSAGPVLALGGEPLDTVDGVLQLADTVDDVGTTLDGSGDQGDDASGADDGGALDAVGTAVERTTGELAEASRTLADRTGSQAVEELADTVEELGSTLAPQDEPDASPEPAPAEEEPAVSGGSGERPRAVVPPGVRAAEGMPLTGAPDVATPRAAAPAVPRSLLAAPGPRAPQAPAVAPPAARDDVPAAPQVAGPGTGDAVAAPAPAEQVARAVRDASSQVPPALRVAAVALVLAAAAGLLVQRDELLAEISRFGRG